MGICRKKQGRHEDAELLFQKSYSLDETLKNAYPVMREDQLNN